MGQEKTKQPQVLLVQKFSYSEELKHHICREFMLGGIGIRELSKKYNISSHSSIDDWLKKYGYRQKTGDISIKVNKIQVGIDHFGINKDLPAEMNSPESTSDKDDSEEVKRLKKELEDAKLRAEAYLRIIEIAEKELNLPIRKKSNTK
jgi:transposase